ncbi:MAG: EAL domain-containing protein [Rhodospirillales bacterium]|nr:EAL domain-containing protein [Rhodospirillales bacterium]
MMPLSRERLLAFAFAPADLLVVLAPDLGIAWAAGAFPARFGLAAEAMIGRPIADLILARDRPLLEATLRTAAHAGRAPPVILRLADDAATPFAVAALALPGAAPELCVSLGPLPVPAPAPPTVPEDDPGFRHAIEARLRDGADGRLSLLELTGAGPEAEAALLDLPATVPGAVAVSRLAPGRYGVLGDAGLATEHLLAAVTSLLSGARARGATLALDKGALSPGQAVRALRLALGRFAAAGEAGLGAATGETGLAALVTATGAEAQAIRRAIGERRFRLAYQPVVGLEDRAVHHHEVLLRPDPLAGGPRDTQDFVTVAEAVGLAEELDLAVLAAVLDRLARAPEVALAANVSGLSLQSPRFRARLLEMLRPHGGGALLVEFTETAEIENLPEAAETLRQLRAAGIPICLDDFGAGGAAFRYLREFRADYVKIDGGFVQRAVRSDRDRAIVAAMIEAARRVDAAIIAEMVETEAQEALMRQLGVQYGQGWRFGRPGVPAEA